MESPCEMKLTFDNHIYIGEFALKKIQLDRPWLENPRLLDVCS